MIPDWTCKLPVNLICQKAAKHNFEWQLIAAICWQESRGSVYAVRYEPNFRYIYKPEYFARKNNITTDTETNLQKQSYGLMQIMGGTARWLGFTSGLPGLYKPENNLFWGCKYLEYLSKRYSGSLADIVAAYNAGNAEKIDGKYKNNDYVADVLGYYSELKV